MRLLRHTRLLFLALVIGLVPASSFAGVFVSINIAPPVLPVYVQPPCPQDGLMWTPGYWAYGEEGYYWVPGAWVPAPYAGALWTPGYWGWSGGLYVFHGGYWGPHVGYYGGVNYGFGYMGVGFAGGEWRGGHFAYNTAIMHVNTTVIHNTYVNETIVHNTTIVNNSHVAYSGGPGGIQHQPTADERVAEHDQHVQPTKFQQAHVQAAAQDRTNLAKVNGGHPQHAVAEKPLAAEAHPAPAAMAHAQPAAHPAMQSHPAPAARTAPEARPAPAARPEARPAPAARPESRPAPAARPESHPAARPAPKPEKEHKG